MNIEPVVTTDVSSPGMKLPADRVHPTGYRPGRAWMPGNCNVSAFVLITSLGLQILNETKNVDI